MQVVGVGASHALVAKIGRSPLCAFSWADTENVHCVNLLEWAVLGLDDEEVNDEEECQAASTEDHTVPVVNLVGNEGGKEGDKEVKEPVRWGSESHAWGTIAGRVELTDDGPNERSPGSGESGDEDAGEDDENFTWDGSRLWVGEGQAEGADKRVDKEAYEHYSGTPHKGLAATDVLHDPETNDSCADINRAEDNGGDVGVRDTGGLEDGCAKVEEEVGTRELLAGLQGHAEEGTVQHTWASEDLRKRVITSNKLSSELLFDLGDLSLDKGAVGVDTIKAS